MALYCRFRKKWGADKLCLLTPIALPKGQISIHTLAVGTYYFRSGAHSQEFKQEALGAAMRALFIFLNQADPRQDWGGLQKTLTHYGTIFWLSEMYHQPYEEMLLAQRYVIDDH